METFQTEKVLNKHRQFCLRYQIFGIIENCLDSIFNSEKRGPAMSAAANSSPTSSVAANSEVGSLAMSAAANSDPSNPAVKPSTSESPFTSAAANSGSVPTSSIQAPSTVKA